MCKRLCKNNSLKYWLLGSTIIKGIQFVTLKLSERKYLGPEHINGVLHETFKNEIAKLFLHDFPFPLKN